MVYKVSIDLDVAVWDEDFSFLKNCELIRDDIKQELASCWHTLDIRRMHFTDSSGSEQYGFIIIPDEKDQENAGQ